MNIDWNALLSSEATVVGLLLLNLALIAFGFLVPRWYVRAMEKKSDYDRARADRQAEAIDTLAEWAKTQTEVGRTVTHTMSSLQNKGREDK